MTEKKYDIVVLGGGAGGVPAAVRAAQLGGRVALIESQFLGGLCMNRGCVPFGHMMAAASIIGNLTLGKEMGLGFTRLTKSYSRLLKRQNEFIGFMRESVKNNLNRAGVTVIKGKGKIINRKRVEVNGKFISLKRLILSTGAKWLKPEFSGAKLSGVINSDGLLVLEKAPKRVLVYDKSPRAIEIAQFLHRYGSKVILATEEKSILPEESKTIRSRLTSALKNQGLTVWSRAKLQDLKKRKDGLHGVLRVKNQKETVLVDQIITVRRIASLTGLGIESVGLDVTGDHIQVNERMETGSQGIYAIGDVASPESKHYSHLAAAGGIVAAENAMGLESVLDHRTLCRILFTQPQVACVGMTSREAKKAGYDVVTGSAPLSMNPFGMIMSQTEGIIEVVADKNYGEILGIHMMGDGAGEMAGQAVLAIQLEVTLEELSRAVFPHPTLSESLAEAARDCLGAPIYLP